MVELNTLLHKLVEDNGSDLFITVGKPPCMKLYGELKPLDDSSLDAEQAAKLIFSAMDKEQREDFKICKESNFAIYLKEIGRFRVNVFLQQSCMGAVIRKIETKIPKLQDLQAPEVLADFAMLKRGLIILVGGTGAGKSSTLAAMIGHRNENSKGHIVTIEDPIEFVHEHQGCIVTQREVGTDTESFEAALKNTLRQAPDVILIGEIRSQETMGYAINFAETGHLCFATLHANNANQALDRIVNFFPHQSHRQLWSDLSLNMRAIIAQQLIPTKDESSRVPAVEILVNTPVVTSAIKKGETASLKEYMTKGGSAGMQTFDSALFNLYKGGKITYKEALKHADSENELRLMIKLSGEQGTSEIMDLKLKDR